jgi:hypothetical protein
LQNLLDEKDDSKNSFSFRDRSDDNKEPVSDFIRKDYEEILKKLQTKRLKLNFEIQSVNFNTKIVFAGESISIAEALEIRKKLLSDIESLSSKTIESAYNKIIHKEERDIINKPKFQFRESHQNFQHVLKQLRILENTIHEINHSIIINFKDE